MGTLSKTIKDLERENAALRGDNEALESENNALRADNAALQAKVETDARPRKAAGR